MVVHFSACHSQLKKVLEAGRNLLRAWCLCDWRGEEGGEVGVVEGGEPRKVETAKEGEGAVEGVDERPGAVLETEALQLKQPLQKPLQLLLSHVGVVEAQEGRLSLHHRHQVHLRSGRHEISEIKK